MKTKLSLQHLPLILGIALPLVFIAIVALMAYVPSQSIHPAHDFAYALEDQTYNHVYKNEYRLKDGKVVLVPADTSAADMRTGTIIDTPKLYKYDLATHTTHEISIEETQGLTLVPGPSSPDGYLVEYRRDDSGGLFLFDGGSENAGYYITKGSAGKKLPGIPTENYYYANGFQIIGWVQ